MSPLLIFVGKSLMRGGKMESLASKVIETVVLDVAKRFSSRLGQRTLPESQDLQELGKALISHTRDILTWSQGLQIFEMKGPRLVADITTEIPMSVPRRLKNTNTSAEITPESDLLFREGNFLILGGPGSGKTTMLKRLAQRILLDPPESALDIWQYPVLIRLQRLSTSSSLIKSIADVIGLKCEVRITKEEKIDRDNDDKTSPTIREITTNYWGNEPLVKALPDLLEKTGAIILLDGLDEVPNPTRRRLEQEIVQLAEQMPQAKILLTCRSGDSQTTFHGFNLVEMCPLRQADIEKISTTWLTDAKYFLKQLTGTPYKDLAENPLFLSYLLVHFENFEYLPAQPKDIYPRICRLALEEWDRHRGVSPRRSTYANFSPDTKLEFLSALSYELTYQCRARRFSGEQLKNAYRAIFDSFGLPREAAEQVAGEIESHTGIIVESGFDHYEFSHLSLQEYLCGFYLVRLPFGDQINRYLTEYPAPVAVAVSLASSPSDWLASILLSTSRLGGAWLQSFFSRIFHERPSLTHSAYLGFGALRLLFLAEQEASPFLMEFLHYKAVPESLRLAMRWYLADAEDGHWNLNRSPGFTGDYGFKIPEKLTLSREIFELLLNVASLRAKGFDFTRKDFRDRYELVDVDPVRDDTAP
jgi:hypothetical protein